MKEQQTPPLDRRPFHLIWPRTNASGRLPSHVTQSTHCDGVWTERKGCRPQICGGAKNRSVQCKVNLLADRHASLAREKKKKSMYWTKKKSKRHMNVLTGRGRALYRTRSRMEHATAGLCIFYLVAARYLARVAVAGGQALNQLD